MRKITTVLTTSGGWRGGPGVAARVFLAVWLTLCAGCAGSPRFEPAALGSPGWEQRRGQLVWRPSGGAPEVVGDLLLARGPGGEEVAEFSKGLPIVLARSGRDGWSLEAAGRGVERSGRGAAPKVGWFLLGEAAFAGRVAAGGWNLEPIDGGGWVLERRRGGERFEFVPWDE